MPYFINAENAYSHAINSAEKQEWQMAKNHVTACLQSLENYLHHSNILGETANEVFINRCKWAVHHLPHIIIMFNQFGMIKTVADITQIKQIYSLLHHFCLKVNYLHLAHYFQFAEKCIAHDLSPNEMLYIIDELTKLLALTIPNSQVDEESYRVVANTQIFIAFWQSIYNRSNYLNQLSPDDSQRMKGNLAWTGITSVTAAYINHYKIQLVKHGARLPQIDLQILLAYLMDKTMRLNESAENLKKQWVLKDLSYRHKDKELNALKRKAELLEKENTALTMRIESRAMPSLPQTSGTNFCQMLPQTSTRTKTFVMPSISEFDRLALSEAFYFPLRAPAIIYSADLAVSIVNLSKIDDQLCERFAYFQKHLDQATTLCDYMSKLQDQQRELVATAERKNSDLKVIVAAMARSSLDLTHSGSAQVSPPTPSVVHPRLSPLSRSFAQNTSPSLLFRPVVVPTTIVTHNPRVANAGERSLFTLDPTTRNQSDEAHNMTSIFPIAPNYGSPQPF